MFHQLFQKTSQFLKVRPRHSGAFSKNSHKNKFDSENKPIGSENIQKSPIVISFCLENSEIIFFSKSAVLGIMVFSKPLTPENRLVTHNGLKILGGPRPPWPPQFRHPCYTSTLLFQQTRLSVHSFVHASQKINFVLLVTKVTRTSFG